MQLQYSNNVCAAFLTEVVRCFQERYPRGFLGRTGVQKLTYFSQALGAPIPCSFEIYNYGPYSDEVRFTIDSLMADEVITDISSESGRYSNYRLGPHADALSPTVKKSVERFRPVVDKVVSALGKFSSEQLELIATIHFVAAKLESLSGSAPQKAEVISGFVDIKGDKFDLATVSSWYDALRSAGWGCSAP
jgi:uncharacterized protein YwgA